MHSTSRHRVRQSNFDETCSDCVRLRLSGLAPNRLFLPERLDDRPSEKSAHGGSARGRQSGVARAGFGGIPQEGAQIGTQPPVRAPRSRRDRYCT
jgi:hypothetical protein